MDLYITFRSLISELYEKVNLEPFTSVGYIQLRRADRLIRRVVANFMDLVVVFFRKLLESEFSRGISRSVSVSIVICIHNYLIQIDLKKKKCRRMKCAL